MNVDERLSAVFMGLDARPGFNEWLLDRLQVEIAAEARRADEARHQEQLRHRIAQQELHPFKQVVGRWVTLETVGIAVLAGVTGTSAWSADQLTAALPVAFTALGVLLAAAPCSSRSSVAGAKEKRARETIPPHPIAFNLAAYATLGGTPRERR